MEQQADAEQPSPLRRLGAATSLATEVIAIGPRTAAYAARSALRPLRQGRRHPEIRARMPTPGLLGWVLVEQLMMAALPAALAPDEPERLAAVREEVDHTIELLDARGWLANPRGFHQDPTPPERPTLERAEYYGFHYEKLSFESGYDAPEGSQGADERWNAPPNRTAHAYVLRHRDGVHPWLVLQHGYSAGQPLDFIFMGARRFHRDLGFNVIAPTAPYHAQRRVFRRSGIGMTSYDYVRNLHAYGQATWDIRRCIRWAETQGAASVALYGPSMGGYLVSLVAGIDEAVDTVIAGIPAVDTAAAIRRRTPARQWADLNRHGLFGECLDLIHRPVNPLSFTPFVAHERRFIYAGIADQITTPGDAYLLWRHWDRPSVLWFRGTHIGTVGAGDVKRFVDDALRPLAVTATEGGDEDVVAITQL